MFDTGEYIANGNKEKTIRSDTGSALHSIFIIYYILFSYNWLKNSSIKNPPGIRAAEGIVIKLVCIIYKANGVTLLGTGDVLGKLVYNKIFFGDEHTDNITDGNHPTEAIFIENG